MATDMNRLNIIGRLVRDPELRYTQTGTAVASFSIANNRTYNVSGEKKESVSALPQKDLCWTRSSLSEWFSWKFIALIALVERILARFPDQVRSAITDFVSKLF